jgi:formylglycine-generating enzyme required for sulfatase activity
MTERFKDRLPTNWGISLPSEAEWEKAARGGVEIPCVVEYHKASDGFEVPSCLSTMEPNPISTRTYPWGNDFNDELCNMSDTGIGATSANGCFANGKSPYGAEEMSGNVWEWTRSRSDLEDLKTLTKNNGLVVRGGAFSNESSFARSAFRNGDSPYFRRWNIGFRVVASPFRL